MQLTEHRRMAQQNGKLKVHRYQASVTRDNTNPRGILTMWGKADPSGTLLVEQVQVFFKDVGTTSGSVAGNAIIATVPRVDFANFYEILHNEDPVYLEWAALDGASPNDPKSLTQIAIVTDAWEKPGEIE